MDYQKQKCVYKVSHTSSSQSKNTLAPFTFAPHNVHCTYLQRPIQKSTLLCEQGCWYFYPLLSQGVRVWMVWVNSYPTAGRLTTLVIHMWWELGNLASLLLLDYNIQFTMFYLQFVQNRAVFFFTFVFSSLLSLLISMANL